jgi:photosystem II stability/assembly factor-like uncharacterized protein
MESSDPLCRVVFSLALVLGGLFASGSASAESERQWTPAGFGGAGLYWSVAFHPTKDGVIYLGGDSAGVYKSADHGLNWVQNNSGLAGYEVLSLAVSPAAPKTVIATTNGGICRSDDEGASWTLLPATAPGKLNLIPRKEASIKSVAIDPKDPSRIYFGAVDGRILRSDNGGADWTVIHTVEGGKGVWSVLPLADGRLLAATQSGIIAIDRSGNARTLLPHRTRSIAATSDPNILYAATVELGICKSIDAGQTWAPIGAELPKGHSAYDLVADPVNPGVFTCITANGWGGAAVRSDDGGRTLQVVTSLHADAENNPTDRPAARDGPVPISNPRCIAVNPTNGKELFVAANWRPFHSADGGRTWYERSKGADIACVTDIRFDGDRTFVTVMDMGALVRDGATGKWQQLVPTRWNKDQSGHMWRLRVWDGGKQLLTTSSPWDAPVNQVFRSMDGGATFVLVRDGLDSPIPTRETMWGRGYPRALAAADPTHPYTLYLGIDGNPDDKGPGGGIFKSEDGGWHWTRLPNQPPSRRVFFALAVDPTNKDRLYWGTCGPDGGIYRSNDAGASWQRVMSDETWVFNLHVTPDGTVYSSGKQLRRSRDHGTTWEVLTDRTDRLDIVGLEVDGDRIWYSTISWSAGTIGDIYESIDAGKTWTRISLDIPYRSPMVLRYNPQTRQLWAAGNGIYYLQR